MSDNNNTFNRRRPNTGTSATVVKSANELFNFEDISLKNLEKLPNNPRLTDGTSPINNKIFASTYFLEDFKKTVTTKDPGTKNYGKKYACLYKDKIRYLEQRSVKVLDIDYIDFTDYISEYHLRVSKICEKYGFDSPYIDITTLEHDYEKTDLIVFMYCKYLLNCLEKNSFEEFQSAMRIGALTVFKDHFASELFLDPLDPNNPDPSRSERLATTHIGVINYPVEFDIPDIRSEMLNRVATIKGDLDSYDDKTRYEVITSKWRCEGCGYNVTSYGTSPPSKCLNPDCGEKKSFRDLNDYTGHEYVYMKISQHIHGEDTLIGLSDIVIKVEGAHLINNFWRRSRQSATLKITGLIKLSQDRLNRNNPDERNLQMNAISIEIEGESTTVQFNEKLLEIIANKIDAKSMDDHYDKLKRSICPHLYQLEPIKEAILLMLTGAVARIDAHSKRRIRGDLVIMLLGDPSLGKSEFGIFITKVNPYAIRTIGGSKTTTAAALTSSWEIIKDVKVISKGVMPRCDLKGIAIIDELDKRNAEDMQVLSIPLDDNQMIPTHKSNYHHDIPARCPVLLIGNASKNSGRWDPSKTITAQTNYGAWLVARSDLIFIFIDDGDLERKQKQVEHMAKSRETMVTEADYNKRLKNKVYTDLQIDRIEKCFLENDYTGYYDTEYLRHELHYLKNTYKPTIKPGSDVEALLKKEYLKFSQIEMVTDDDNNEYGPYTKTIMDARAYNALERIAMTVARCRRHHMVTKDDMERAISLMMSSVSSMLPRPRNDIDKLKDGSMAVYKQMDKFLKSSDGFKNYFEAENSGWEAKRKVIQKKVSHQLHRYVGMLRRIGFENCTDCRGVGDVSIESADGMTTEQCFSCKGAKSFPRPWRFDDFESVMQKQKVMTNERIKSWFNMFRDQKLIISKDRSFECSDVLKNNIYISDLLLELSDRISREELQSIRNNNEANITRG